MRTLLWKEFRDQRAALCCIWGCMAVALIAGVFVSGGYYLLPGATARFAAEASGLLAFVVLGLPLFAGEWERGHASHVARTPQGLGQALAAKVLFLLVAVGSCAFAAAVAVSLCRMGLVLQDRGSGAAVAFEYASLFQLPFGLLVACALWWVAVPTWGLRSGVAMIGTPIVIAVLTLPWWPYALESNRPALGIFGWFWAISGATAMASLWAGFGLRRKAGRRWAIPLAASLALVGNSPAWARAGWHLWNAGQVHPGTQAFQIESGYVGENGRFAFISAQNRDYPGSTYHNFRIDLRDGSWSGLPASNSVSAQSYKSFPFGTSWGFPYAKTVQIPGSDDLTEQRGSLYFDLNQGERVFQDDAIATRAIDRARTYPDTLALVRWRDCLGLGARVGPPALHQSGEWIYDGGRDEFYSIPAGSMRVRSLSSALWLVLAKQNETWVWRQYDPETKALTPAPGLKKGDALGPTTGTGLVFLIRENTLHLYDQTQGQTIAVAQPEGYPQFLSFRELGESGNLFDGRTPPVIRVRRGGPDGKASVAWVEFDPGTSAPKLHWHAYDEIEATPMASTEPDCVTFVRDGFSIVRVNLKTKKEQLLFPTELTREPSTQETIQ